MVNDGEHLCLCSFAAHMPSLLLTFFKNIEHNRLKQLLENNNAINLTREESLGVTIFLRD